MNEHLSQRITHDDFDATDGFFFGILSGLMLGAMFGAGSVLLFQAFTA